MTRSPGTIEQASRSGFSLIELLIVLAIIMAIAGLAWPSFQNSLRTHQLKSDSERVRDFLSRGRIEAIDSGVIYQFRYEPSGTYVVLVPWEQVDESEEGGGPILRRYSDGVDEGLSFRAVGGDVSTVSERLENDAFNGLDAAATLSQVSWSEAILFYPDGTADGGSFELVDDKNQYVTLDVRGLTGAASVSEIYGEEP